MKGILVVLALFIVTAVNAQTQEVAQLLLNYEKLKQLEEILDNMYKGYRILSQGYNRVKDIAEGNFNLHQLFLDGLYAVNPSVAKYRRIPGIIQYQAYLMREYKRAFSQLKNDPNLTPGEIGYIEKVYESLVKQSLTNLEALTMIVTAKKLRMNDEERLRAIDKIYFDIAGSVSFMQYFNNGARLLIIQRAKEAEDIQAVRRLNSVD